MLLHELDEDKNPARHYVLGNEYIGLDHNYYLTDEQGSVRYVLDAAGNVQNDYRYDLRARYYNTGIGRFTQEDVIYNDGLNLYAYCSSNPVMYADTSGYSCEPKAAAENSKGNNTSKEIILAIEKTHESARNTLVLELQKTGAFKNGSESYIGRLESSYGFGKKIGRISLDKKVRWRLDFDKKIGVHYNIENFKNGKKAKAIKKVIPINISYNEYVQILDS